MLLTLHPDPNGPKAAAVCICGLRRCPHTALPMFVIPCAMQGQQQHIAQRQPRQQFGRRRWQPAWAGAAQEQVRA